MFELTRTVGIHPHPLYLIHCWYMELTVFVEITDLAAVCPSHWLTCDGQEDRAPACLADDAGPIYISLELRAVNTCQQ